MRRTPFLLAMLPLAACDSTAVDSSSVFPWIQPPAMEKAQGIENHGEGQDTPDLQARAEEEREGLPAVPPEVGPDNFYNLGTVPPRPKMPTIAEIAGEANALDAEQQAQMAKIAIQAGAPLPEVLKKPNENGTPPAMPASPGLDTQQIHSPAMGGVATMTMSGDNSTFLPQSQSVEATDLMRPEDR